MTTATDTTPINPISWIAEHGGTSWRAATTAGVYRVQKHPRGGYVVSFETEGGVLRYLDHFGDHVGKWDATRVPGLGEAKVMGQIHADKRPHAVVVPLQREDDVRHTFWPGEGVSWDVGSDRYPGTVVKVSKTSVWVRRDDFVRTDRNGMSEDQSYRFVQREVGELIRFTLRKDGRLRRAGRKSYSALSHGRSAHQDPHF